MDKRQKCVVCMIKRERAWVGLKYSRQPSSQCKLVQNSFMARPLERHERCWRGEQWGTNYTTVIVILVQTQFKWTKHSALAWVRECLHLKIDCYIYIYIYIVVGFRIKYYLRFLLQYLMLQLFTTIKHFFTMVSISLYEQKQLKVIFALIFAIC